MKRLKKQWPLWKERLRDAYRVLFRKHYFLFSTNREIDPAQPEQVYFDVQWQQMRRQDVYEIGGLCFRLLAEDDECQSLVDEANDLLK
jgi:predicted RNA-binding protein associated with RNAse of E/G family